jgi:hypothetical protein
VPAASGRPDRGAAIEGIEVIRVDTLREAVDSALQASAGRVASAPARC